MFKHLFRFTVGAFVWKRYKRLILSTLALFFYFWLVAKMHGDFIAYSSINSTQTNLGLSFVIKWLAFAVGLLVFWLFNLWRRKVQDAQPSDIEAELLTKKSKTKTTGSPGQRTSQLLSDRMTDRTTDRTNKVTTEPDPFAQIRQRKKLRSRAELIIENKK